MRCRKWALLVLFLALGGCFGWTMLHYPSFPKPQVHIVGLDKDGLCVIEVLNPSHEALRYMDDGPFGPDYRVETFLDGKWRSLSSQIAMCGDSQTNEILPGGQKLTFKVVPSPAGRLRIGIFLWPESHKFKEPIHPEWLPKAASDWLVEWQSAHLRQEVARFTYWSDELPNQRIDISAAVQANPFDEFGTSSSASTY